MLIPDSNVLLLLSGRPSEFRGIAQIRLLRTFLLRYYFPGNCLGFPGREKITTRIKRFKNNDVKNLGRQNIHCLSSLVSAGGFRI